MYNKNNATTKNIIFVEYNFLVVFCCLVGGSFLKIAGT